MGPDVASHLQAGETGKSAETCSPEQPEESPAQSEEELGARGRGREDTGQLAPASGGSPCPQHWRSGGGRHRACCTGEADFLPPLPSRGLTPPAPEISPQPPDPGLPAPAAFSTPTCHRVGAGRPGTPVPTKARDTAPGSSPAWWLWPWARSQPWHLSLAGVRSPAYLGQPKSTFGAWPPEGLDARSVHCSLPRRPTPDPHLVLVLLLSPSPQGLPAWPLP